VPEPKNPALPKMREWPMFRKQPHRAKSSLLDGRSPPRIADLVMAHVPGSHSVKLAWLRQQCAEGKLDGDDPEEIMQAEALLVMLARIAGGKGERHKRRHLDELLDEGLKQTFPASDPVSVGHFTSTEAPSNPVDRGGADSTTKTKGPRKPARASRVA